MTLRRTVLVVDDDPALRRSMTFLLQSFGYEVRSFADGRSFLAAAADAPDACVLLDLSMPGADGLTVLDELRRAGQKQPVIFVTGHGALELESMLKRDGVVAVLPKPFDADELIGLIESARPLT